MPVVHVTVNGVATAYQDDEQILNTAGADLASCPGNTWEQNAFTQINPGVQPSAVAVNMIPPVMPPATPAASRVGSAAVVGETLAVAMIVLLIVTRRIGAHPVD